MPTYVAQIEGEHGLVLERADVTVELLPGGEWRARFVVDSSVKVTKGAELELAFADGRRGRAKVHHVHKPSPKQALRLVELAGMGQLN
jgi:hypothetical protein